MDVCVCMQWKKIVVLHLALTKQDKYAVLVHFIYFVNAQMTNKRWNIKVIRYGTQVSLSPVNCAMWRAECSTEDQNHLCRQSLSLEQNNKTTAPR